MKRAWIVGALGMVLVAAGGAWLVTAVADNGDESSGPGPVVQMTPPAVLAKGAHWQLVVTPEQALALFRNSGAIASVRGSASPLTLNQASSFLVPEHHGLATIVAGPVDERAARVTVETSRGATMNAAVVGAHDSTWFWAEFPGRVAVSGIEARGEDGAIVDEFALPQGTPSPDPIVVGRMKRTR